MAGRCALHGSDHDHKVWPLVKPALLPAQGALLLDREVSLDGMGVPGDFAGVGAVYVEVEDRGADADAAQCHCFAAQYGACSGTARTARRPR
jgi:hypothetical protein